MSSLTANAIACPATLPIVRTEVKSRKQIGHIGFCPLDFNPLVTQFQPFDRRRPMSRTIGLEPASIICAAALNARCGAEQTQTVTRQSSTITVAPIQGALFLLLLLTRVTSLVLRLKSVGKEKSPELDDGGTGFPPRDDDGGGGGGGGGGGWSGGFFFFGFLAFLGFLKDQESEGPYRDERKDERIVLKLGLDFSGCLSCRGR
ncbi:unnamed protein product [Ilex paraguariensis]|uniref:Glycine-rich protein n=1 Tax=Ilex paraguariensis TaxID=185542 RepID=A0ABC8T2R8_9AQUA